MGDEHSGCGRATGPAVGAGPLHQACGTTVDALNDACFCISLDHRALDAALATELGDPRLAALLRERCPHVFAEYPVFVAPAQLQRIEAVVRAVEQVVALPAWREQALAAAPAIARHDVRGVRGVFFGYDFHVEGDTLGLIEINTNAGGAMLNAVLARAQRVCCEGVAPLLPSREGVEGFERAMLEMFRCEWRAAGRQAPLRRVAIVDEAPERQYLYPEFLLFRHLLGGHGIETLIADPAEFVLRAGQLFLGEQAIDLVYNRLTDFYLQGDDCRSLREAYLSDAVVLTPHPQAHALYADKRRLADLSDPEVLARLGVAQETQAILLRDVPRTRLVRAEDAERLWAERRGLFFKPVSGFGSRGAYRGDKLTRRVWQDILDGGYVAQALVAPGERRTAAGRPMKYDLRAYVYDGRIQWLAARVYQGQTTNFRTEGGGFAPVFTLAESDRDDAPEPAEYRSHTFLLDEAGRIHFLPHPLYVALVHAESAPPALAGRRFRLADWYVRLRDGVAEQLLNEWYGWVEIDADGRFRPAPAAGNGEAAGAVDASALPTAGEHERMATLVFGPGSGDAGAAGTREPHGEPRGV
ncbi:hypothetical protein [Azotobacter salinestris]|uniref:hypothetical protein n=1 Tax=Azotobacter salinestris TaxID=69964 RepID=UPI0032DEAB5B